MILILVGISCSPPRSILAPKKMVPKQNEILSDAFGGWMELGVTNRPNKIEGEFIAIHNDSIFVLKNDQLSGFPKGDIQFARVIFYNTQYNAMAFLTSISSLATISNGIFLIGTLPLNIVVGVFSNIAERKRLNYRQYPDQPWEELSKFSRFPQGLPKGGQRREIKSRKWLRI
ncbi:hypothetical protein QWY93_10595 [Echinicola jeungdonensis]|uniref:Apolipoprotein D and lipocalin family protein n=1 Tax=Echinicola jeungdonensis TaxID=709343 RepID=A0ABV5J2J8_9BACT|nr:hypothetical protein [Echinicola jeungdonensis]MDN3669771.1 hypothetical protein [Echinicola jeungdonensis]